MGCTACGAELIPGKKFCHACGTRVAVTCRGCGATLDQGFKFCPDCGLRVGDEGVDLPPPVAEPAPSRFDAAPVEGERKQVTVLFCDLAGSTAIAERLDPEEYRDLIEQYLALAFREIYRFEGMVNQLAGDGLMALFGAPVSHEDDPQRAVRAALGIRDALVRFNRRLTAEGKAPLLARVGVNTGPVVVGTVGTDRKMDYTAIGDTTNLAARLESLCPPGSVLISESTQRLVRGLFDLKPTGPLEVKGKVEPVTAYEVLGSNEVWGPMGVAIERGLTPFIGRDEELQQLEASFQRLASGQTQVVVVVGDAGLGKSRLLYEAKRHLHPKFAQDGKPAGAVLLEARCSSMSQSAPYAPFVTMLRRYFAVDPDEACEEACEKVRSGLDTWDGRPESIYPLLSRFLGLPTPDATPLPPDELKRASFDALAELVLAESRRVPVVLAIEDLHWIDDASRELLEYLVARLAGARVMVVVSQRPEERPPWWAHAALTQIVLRRLADADVASIVRAVAGGPLPAQLEAALVAKAEGSPFVAEEMTRALLEEGHLVRDGEGVRVTRAIGDIPIPGTVQEVIAARLDRLGPAAKRVAQVAAVLGRQFDRNHLVQLLAPDGVDVGRALVELEERGLIHRKSLLANDEYRFGESLTQEVAYEGLLLRQRRQLHDRIGLLLEKESGKAGADRTAILAHHFSRGDDPRRALRALVAAGDTATEVPSYRSAVEFYRRAWELAEPMLDERADEELRRLALAAALGLCQVTVLFGATTAAWVPGIAQRGQALADELGDAESKARLCYVEGIATMASEGGLQRGIALAEEGVAIAERAGLKPVAMGLSRGLGVTYVLDGRFAIAEEVTGQVVRSLEDAGHKERLSDLYVSSRWVRDAVLHLSDEIDEAARATRETYDMAVRAPNRTVRSASASTLGQIHFVRGEYEQAKRWADEAFEIAEAIGNVPAFPAAAAIALASRVELGEKPSPGRYLDAIEQGLGTAGSLQLNIRFVGEALAGFDVADRAARLAEQLRRGPTGGRLRQTLIMIAAADLLLRAGRVQEAAEGYGHAIARAEEIGARAPLVAATLGAATIASERGEPVMAAALARAIDVARALRLERYRPRLERLLGTGTEAVSA